jgi:hypothetical protein
MEENTQVQIMDDLQDKLWALDGSTTHFLLGSLASIRRRDAEFIARIADASSGGVKTG